MRRVLIISADMFEVMEFLVPYYRLKEEGMDVTVASPDGGRIRGKRGYEVDSDLALGDVDPADFDALVIPGGKAPAELRKNGEALDIARHFFRENKPVMAICHGPQVLISAGVIKGRRATCYRKVAGELREAGARYEDREVVVDGNLVTSRHPADLPAFMREGMKKLR